MPVSPKKHFKICDEWFREKNINPRTNRTIKKNGPVYMTLQKECSNIKIKRARKARSLSPNRHQVTLPRVQSLSNLKKQVCEEWHNKPDVNPRTDRKIKLLGPVYNKLKKECHESIIDVIEDKKETEYDKRMKVGDRIIKNLNFIEDVDNWNVCISGKNSIAFKKNFDNIKRIGKGSFGQIFVATLNSDKVIIKEANLSNIEERVLKQNISPDDKDIFKNKKIMPLEYQNLNYVNELLLSKKCPNFLYTYTMALCDGCKVVRLFTKSVSPRSCYVTYMEYADGSLYDTKLDADMNQQFSVLYQLLAAVYSIHHYFAIFHKDIKAENILIKKIKPGGFFKYVINEKIFHIQNSGILVFLADFGVSTSLSPKYGQTQFFGTRNAKVVEKNGNLIWKPFKTKYFADYENKDKPPKLSNPYYLKWIDNLKSKPKIIDTGTFNKFGTTNIYPFVKIDLNDNRKFPCFEFFADIQDVIRLFIGGKQAFQQGKHWEMRNLNKYLKECLTKYAYLDKQEKIYYIAGTVKYILAEEMLSVLFKFHNPKVDYIIDTFYL
jgi:serine/threonine protein kinase